MENAEIIEKSLDDIFQITFDYALMSEVMSTVKKIELEIVEQDFGEIGKLKIAIPKDKVADKMILLKAGIAKVRVEEVPTLEEIEGAEIEFLYVR